VVFGIPYGYLVPKQIENILVAGRCISTESKLMDSIREIPVCIATGQAAGVAAAMNSETGTRLRSLDIPSLQQRLLALGVNLGSRWQA